MTPRRDGYYACGVRIRITREGSVVVKPQWSWSGLVLGAMRAVKR